MHIHLHGEDGLLGYAHQGTSNSQNESKESEVDVQRHHGDPVVLPQPRRQKGHKSGHILQREDDHRGEPQPRVQGVHVGNGRIGQVVGIEDRLQGNHRQNECTHVDAGVGELQSLLARGAETTINQNGCGIELSWITISKLVNGSGVAPLPLHLLTVAIQVNEANGHEQRMPVELHAGIGGAGQTAEVLANPGGHQDDHG